MRLVFMLLTSILVSAAMAATLFVFFRRLRQIEVLMWGAKQDVEGLRAALQRRKRAKERVVKS
jgi:hypothetical protein